MKSLLIVLSVTLAVAVLLTLALWPWVRGRAALALVVAGAFMVGRAVGDGMAVRPWSWQVPAASAFAGLITWMLAGWFPGPW